MNENKQLFNLDTNAFEDLKSAQAEAFKLKKNILVELGADWCVWCHRLESFIASHSELYLLRSQFFVHVRVYTGDGRKRTEICNHLPPFDGIPHFFVYNPDGKLIHSQHTSELEEGETYNYEKVWNFLSSWSTSHIKGDLQ